MQVARDAVALGLTRVLVREPTLAIDRAGKVLRHLVEVGLEPPDLVAGAWKWKTSAM